MRTGGLALVLLVACEGGLKIDAGLDTDPGDTDRGGTDAHSDDPSDPPVGDHPVDAACAPTAAAEDVAAQVCPSVALGTGAPVIERRLAPGRLSLATPVVADLDGDRRPEILVNTVTYTQAGFFNRGRLLVIHGHDGSLAFEITEAGLGFAAPVAVGDLDGDGEPEIVGVRSTGSMLPLAPLANATYEIVAWSRTGAELWASETFDRRDLDYATAPLVADLDGDGAAEVIAGRVILHGDGRTRGVGKYGRGSWGVMNFGVSEGGLAAVADLDGDGTAEVVVGNALYAPDGADLWTGGDEGHVAVANLDDDHAIERLVFTKGTVRALDDDHALLWGPVALQCDLEACLDVDEVPPVEAQIAGPPAVGDLDGDGRPEIVVAGGSEIVALHHDGTELWSSPAEDPSGAAGPSLADLDGNGTLEVVYADETSLRVLDGRTGATLLRTDEHGSRTMFEYPVVVDVDGDGQVEILVAQSDGTHALHVYGAPEDGWWAGGASAWPQHAFAEIPHTWHAAPTAPKPSTGSDTDLTVEVAEVCTDACARDNVVITVEVQAVTPRAVAAGVHLAVLAVRDGAQTPLGTRALSAVPGLRSLPVTLSFRAADLADVDALVVRVDEFDAVAECDELDNAVWIEGPFCP